MVGAVRSCGRLWWGDHLLAPSCIGHLYCSGWAEGADLGEEWCLVLLPIAFINSAIVCVDLETEDTTVLTGQLSAPHTSLTMALPLPLPLHARCCCSYGFAPIQSTDAALCSYASVEVKGTVYGTWTDDTCKAAKPDGTQIDSATEGVTAVTCGCCGTLNRRGESATLLRRLQAMQWLKQ